MIYGGFSDWQETMRFCLEGEPESVPPRLHDPLNRPVIYLNLLDTLPGAPADTAPLAAAWRAYVEATWGQEIYKRGGRHQEVARRMAKDLDPSVRELFLEGCGVDGSSNDRVHEALKASGGRPWLDPRPRLHRIRCPVSMVHGIDDDVIPAEEMESLRAAFSPDHRVETYRTGWLGHAGRAGLADILGAVPLALRELRTMGAMLGALCRTAGLESSHGAGATPPPGSCSPPR
jgi:pimeloyl-ACP methyl ester carboxylesterase